MASPFPGMDPYLEDEALWPLFQHQLVAALYQIILPGLVDRYRARIQQRTYVTEEPLFTSVIRQERHEEYIEIRQRTDGRLVTLSVRHAVGTHRLGITPGVERTGSGGVARLNRGR